MAPEDRPRLKETQKISKLYTVITSKMAINVEEYLKITMPSKRRNIPATKN